jgi:hypothetical protein
MVLRKYNKPKLIFFGNKKEYDFYKINDFQKYIVYINNDTTENIFDDDIIDDDIQQTIYINLLDDINFLEKKSNQTVKDKKQLDLLYKELEKYV